MPRKQPKFEYSIICDDIRQEIGNKMTFVGVYQDLIIVQQIPVALPKLCFYVQYKDIRAGDQFKLKLADPSDKIMEKPIEITVPAKQKPGKMRIFGAFSPLKIEEAGQYTLTIIVNGNKQKKQEINFEVTERTKD